MTNKRELFLEHYLRLLGAARIEWNSNEINKISGKVIYQDNDEQEFCWHMFEENVPSEKVIKLIKIIQINHFINIDKLTESRAELFNHSKEQNYQEFNKTIDELLNVKVSLIDDGKETDYYFIHE